MHSISCRVQVCWSAWSLGQSLPQTPQDLVEHCILISNFSVSRFAFCDTWFRTCLHLMNKFTGNYISTADFYYFYGAYSPFQFCSLIENTEWSTSSVCRETTPGHSSVFVSTSQSTAILQGPRACSLRKKHPFISFSGCKYSSIDVNNLSWWAWNRTWNFLVLHSFSLTSSYLYQEVCPNLEDLFSPVSPASVPTAASSPDDKVWWLKKTFQLQNLPFF